LNIATVIYYLATESLLAQRLATPDILGRSLSFIGLFLMGFFGSSSL
jgi:hypothetical protein